MSLQSVGEINLTSIPRIIPNVIGCFLNSCSPRVIRAWNLGCQLNEFLTVRNFEGETDSVLNIKQPNGIFQDLYLGVLLSDNLTTNDGSIFSMQFKYVNSTFK